MCRGNSQMKYDSLPGYAHKGWVFVNSSDRRSVARCQSALPEVDEEGKASAAYIAEVSSGGVIGKEAGREALAQELAKRGHPLRPRQLRTLAHELPAKQCSQRPVMKGWGLRVEGIPVYQIDMIADTARTIVKRTHEARRANLEKANRKRGL